MALRTTLVQGWKARIQGPEANRVDMNHKEAVELQAAVKYVLGELPAAERDSFEEHYFDCRECALDVKGAAGFVDVGRKVLRAERVEAAAAARSGERGREWFLWLRPAFAVPAMAALLIVVAYQNVITIPQAKQEAARGAGQVFTSSFTLQRANMRGGQVRGEGSSGGEEAKVRVHADESFGLKFDFTPAKTFNNYLCELQDESGRTLIQETLPGTSANQEVQFAVRGGLVKPGKYNLVFTGAPDANGQGTREEVLRLGFLVEFLP